MKHCTIVLLVTLCIGLAGCLDDRRQNRAEGDSCTSTAECEPGLLCVGQACVVPDPLERTDDGRDVNIGPRRDVGGPDADQDLPPGVDTTPDDPVDPPPDVSPDVPPDSDLRICTPDERDCASNFEIRICNRAGTAYDRQPCPPATYCQGGRCLRRVDCEDRDGDDWPAGPDCDGQTDCNDDNATVFPNAREDCTDFLDNNCNGQVDEGAATYYQDADGDRFGNPNRTARACQGDPLPPGYVRNGRDCDDRDPQVHPDAPEQCNRRDDNCNRRTDEGGVCDMCTPGSCPRGQLCVDGACAEAPADECRFQNQPCNPFRTDGDGQYACVSFQEDDDGLCFGVCEYNDPESDLTCPDPGSLCAFEIGDGQGFCLRECDAATNTGCFEGQGCIAIRHGGGCVPVGNRGTGDDCDIDRGPFGQCEAGLICAEFGRDGTCERLCNPAREAQGLPRVCSGDQACLSFSADFGVCTDSIEQPEGSDCRRFEVGAPCGDDVMCLPIGRRDNSCQRICRLQVGDDDCINGGRCRRNEFLGDFEGLGSCQ